MAEIFLKKIGPYKLAYIEHVGDYSKIPFNEYMERLYGWAQQKNIQPMGSTHAMYLDDPKQVSLDKCRSEIGIPIVVDAQPEGNIKIKDMPEMEVATTQHAAPGSELQNTYNALYKWIAENGYECTRPCIEIYHKAPETVGGQVIIYAEVRVPVMKR